MTSPSPLIVIFGAAIGRNGEPSTALLRRTGYGLAAESEYAAAPVLCSGGRARPGSSETSIMAERLQAAGIAPERLILDEASLTTRQNVDAAVHWAGCGGHRVVVICSDAYHLPRIGMLLGLRGIEARRGPVPTGPGTAPLGQWLIMSLRESLAIPVYLVMIMVSGLRLRPQTGPTPGRGF